MLSFQHGERPRSGSTACSGKNAAILAYNDVRDSSRGSVNRTGQKRSPQRPKTKLLSQKLRQTRTSPDLGEKRLLQRKNHKGENDHGKTNHKNDSRRDIISV